MGGRDHYLSAPGGEAATFGRGGGAGGFKLKYRAKTKQQNEHGDIQHEHTEHTDKENDTGVNLS